MCFVLVAAMLVRTLFARDVVRVGRSNVDGTRHADVYVSCDAAFLSVQVARWSDWGFEDPFPEMRHRFAGFRWMHQAVPPTPHGFDAWLWWDHYVDQPSRGGANEVWRVQVRPWLLLVPPAIMPALWIKRLARRRRMLREGLCLQCGYDLRATSGRCPECGSEREIGAAGGRGLASEAAD